MKCYKEYCIIIEAGMNDRIREDFKLMLVVSEVLRWYPINVSSKNLTKSSHVTLKSVFPRGRFPIWELSTTNLFNFKVTVFTSDNCESKFYNSPSENINHVLNTADWFK